MCACVCAWGGGGGGGDAHVNGLNLPVRNHKNAAQVLPRQHR